MNKERILHIHVKSKWFVLMKSGEKTIEYRDCTEYWIKRILNRVYDKVYIYNAYKKATKENILKFKWKGFKIRELINPNTDIFGKCFCITVDELIKE